jgi:hypothetical protein
MQRFNLKELNKVENTLRSKIGLQLWTQRWKLIVPGKQLERISTFQPKRV